MVCGDTVTGPSHTAASVCPSGTARTICATPIVPPDELLRSARVEQRVDVALAVDAALPIRRGELDPCIAGAHAFQHALETGARGAARGIGAAEMIDDHIRSALANARKHGRE